MCIVLSSWAIIGLLIKIYSKGGTASGVGDGVTAIPRRRSRWPGWTAEESGQVFQRKRRAA